MNSKTAYWLGFATTAAVFITSGFNLIKYLLEDHDVLNQIETEEELTLELQYLHNVLTSEFAVKLLSFIQQAFQREFDSSYESLIAQRRMLLYNPPQYETTAKELIIASDTLFKSTASTILKALKICFTLEQILVEISKLSSNEKERLFFKYDKLKVNRTFTSDLIKKAYTLYHSALLNEVKLFKEKAQAISNLDEHSEEIAYKLLIGQIRASDVLYAQYQITDKELIFLIYDSKLIDTDKEIQQKHNEVHQLDNMFTSNIT